MKEPAPTNAGPAPLLEICGASRRFDERAALNGVDLTIQAGEIHALIGPNGAGKTTLVRAICGRLVLDSGSVRVGGRDPVSDPRARSLLGLVPQSIALYPQLTARENLEVLGRLCGVSGNDLVRAVDDALHWSGLEERAGERTATLSGGMQRRLNIVAGILHGPQLLMLDEPTVGVDPAARDRIHGLLRELRADGLAVLMTTHDLAQVAELADRVAVLLEGRIRAEGTPEGLIREAFGDAKELIVTLRAPPDPCGRGLLEREALRPARGERTWEGLLTGGLERLPDLERRLLDAALDVDEIRIREPGLEGAFFRLTGESIDA